MTNIKKGRNRLFLQDVARLAITAFGGPQAHLAMFLDLLVKKRGYIREDDFLEINALCQILPGPSSTQTITAIGYRVGGLSLAYWTLMIWSLPGVALMTLFGVLFSYLSEQGISLKFMHFVQPVAIGFVCYAAVRVTGLVVGRSATGIFLMLASALAAYFFRQPWVFPIVVVLGGLITARNYEDHPEHQDKSLRINWYYFFWFWGVLIAAALLGWLTRFKLIILFENFYRNGSFIYGGGQVLIPVLLTEFVKAKQRLSEDEFLTGFGLSQFVPGPVFSFAAFLGVLSMREYGILGEIAGGLVASLGVFLPGTFLIFFIIGFWENLKKYRVIKASLEGIHAASSGLVIGGAFILALPVLEQSVLNVVVMLIAFALLQFTNIHHALLIITAIFIGLAEHWWSIFWGY